MKPVSRVLLLLILALALPAKGHVQGQEIRDPMRPPAVLLPPPPVQEAKQVNNATPVLNLQGIKVLGSQRTAVINGTTLSIGDTISGARVTRIDPGRVWLIHGNGNHIVLGFRSDAMQITTSSGY
ncbi:hypothetical protein [Desulfonatronum parangueonense]